MPAAVAIVDFEPEHARAFKLLNLNWIRVHWDPEPADFATLDHPDRLLAAGGHIFIAKRAEEIIGTCALLRMDASRVYLESNSVLEPAINLYQTLGFERIQPSDGAPRSAYSRCNIQMQLML